MAEIRELERQPKQEIIDALEDILKQAHKGNIQNIVIVGDHTDTKQIFNFSEFEDRLKLLGALEMAKSSLIRA